MTKPIKPHISDFPEVLANYLSSKREIPPSCYSISYLGHLLVSELPSCFTETIKTSAFPIERHVQSDETYSVIVAAIFSAEL